jgi:hypothetical protein
MTAVEWLIKELFTKHSLNQQIIDTFEHAKEMEKQQIENAYVFGFKECEKIHEEEFFIQDLSEQYYNETYKKITYDT